MPAAPPLRGFGVPAVLESFAAAALGADRLAGNPRQVVPNAGGLLVAKAVPAVGHVVVGQRPHVGPTLQQLGSRVLDGPPPRPEVPDDLDGLQDQAVAVLEPSRSSGQGPRELRADGGGPDQIEVPGRVGPVVPLPNVGADAGPSRRVRVKTRYLPPKGLEGTAHRLGAAEQLQQTHFRVAMTKATGRQRRPPARRPPRFVRATAFFMLHKKGAAWSRKSKPPANRRFSSAI